MFGSVFRVSHLKTAVLRFWGLPRFAGFLEFSLWFSVFVNNDGGFSVFFLSSAFYGFSGFAKAPFTWNKSEIERDCVWL